MEDAVARTAAAATCHHVGAQEQVARTVHCETLMGCELIWSVK